MLGRKWMFSRFRILEEHPPRLQSLLLWTSNHVLYVIILHQSNAISNIGCQPAFSRRDSWFLIDPIKLRMLVLNDLALVEPQRDLLLRALDSIGAVADITADVLSKSLSVVQCLCKV